MNKRWWKKKNQDGKLYLSIAIILSTLMFIGLGSWIAWAGIQSENGMYGWYSAGSKWVKIGTTSSGGVNTNITGDKTAADNYTNPTDALASLNFLMGYDGSTWDRIYSHPMDNNALTYNKSGLVTASGIYGRAGTGTINNWSPILDFNAYPAGIASGTAGALVVAPYGRDVTNGGVDPINILPTLADTITVFGAQEVMSALYGYNGSTYDRLVSAGNNSDNVTVSTLGNLKSNAFLYGYDGTNWDRAKIDTNGSLYVNPGALAYTTDTITVYPPDPSYSHISTNTSTQVKSATGYLMGISVNKAGASANTITLYDNTSCATTIIGVIDGTIAGNVDLHGLKFATGLCITTATGTAPDLTVVYK